MNNYVDVLNMIKQFTDLDNMKFVFFNKKQLAVFKNLGTPDDPINHDRGLKKNKRFNIQAHPNEHSEKILQFLDKNNEKTFNCINRRLYKYFMENIK